MLGIVFELLNSTSGCSHWPAACSCCFSQIWVLSESCRELCCCAFHGRYDQLCQCSLLAACSVQRAGVFQANINVKYCKYIFFFWKVYTLSVSGDRLIVGTAGRRVLVWDLRNMGYVQQRRESSLKYQTRCIRAFPNKQVWQQSHFCWIFFRKMGLYFQAYFFVRVCFVIKLREGGGFLYVNSF